MGLFRGNTPAFSFGVAAWLLGCQPAVEDPIRAASRFVAVAGYGQGVSIWPHLSAETRRILEREAERASNQIGERRNIAPSEMLQIVDVPTFDPPPTPITIGRIGKQAKARRRGKAGRYFAEDPNRKS